MKTYQQDHKVMELLNLKEISRVICDTNMGTLKLRIRKGEKEYQFVLDAVELDKNTNKELFELLYPPPVADIEIDYAFDEKAVRYIKNNVVSKNDVEKVKKNGKTK